MADQTPHFDLPFRIGGVAVQTVEQGSVADVVNCVQAVLIHRPGDRELLPDFGVFDQLTFGRQPLSLADIEAAVQEWEPRATSIIESYPDAFDRLLVHINALVSLTEGAPDV